MVRDTARIFYTVHVSSKAYFGKTRLRGNKKVAAKIITRELAYKEGEEYSNQKIDDSRTRLLNLHLFSAVTFNPDLESAAREIPIDLMFASGPRATSASAAATARRTTSAGRCSGTITTGSATAARSRSAPLREHQ